MTTKPNSCLRSATLALALDLVTIADSVNFNALFTLCDLYHAILLYCYAETKEMFDSRISEFERSCVQLIASCEWALTFTGVKNEFYLSTVRRSKRRKIRLSDWCSNARPRSLAVCKLTSTSLNKLRATVNLQNLSTKRIDQLVLIYCFGNHLQFIRF